MSKYVDVNAIIGVIGCVYQDLSLLGLEDKYNIIEEDFETEFQKILFGTAYHLYNQGAKKITPKDVEDFLSNKEDKLLIYHQSKGGEYILKACHVANLDSFDVYYSKLKKMSILRAYERMGINVRDIYDPDEIFDMKKKVAQEEFIDNCSIQDIIDKIDSKIDAVKLKYIGNENTVQAEAGDDILDLIVDLEQTPDVGAPLYGNFINTVTRGARLNKYYLRSAPSGLGKRVADYTPIPTPDGWKTVGDIKVGDYIFGKNGKPTKVLALYKNNEKIWKMNLVDGRSIDCCGEHLWEYYTDGHYGLTKRVENTQTIFERAQQFKYKFKNYNNTGWRFKLPINQPVEYEEKKFKVSPYAMGLILGDGSLRYHPSNKAFTFSSGTEELPNNLGQEIGYIPIRNSLYNYKYCFKSSKENKHNLWVEELLSDYPQLWNKKSEDKYIPREYLIGSIQQRYDLLQGLLDTDGSIDKKGRVSFTTISQQLANNVCELCQSLGMIAKIYVDTHKEYPNSDGKCYIVHIQCKKSLKPNLFRLEAKKQKALEYAQSNKKEEYKDYLPIKSIEPTEEVVPMTCFTVDASDALFQVGDYVVTHNTRSMVADVCNLACDKIYMDGKGWVDNGEKQSTLYISVELDLQEVQTMMLAFLSNVNEEHIINGRYEPGERDRVVMAGKILQDSKIHIEIVPDFTMKDIEGIIKRNIRENKVEYIFFDYLSSSLGILSEISQATKGMKLREDNILFMLSTKLKDICNQYGVFLLTSTQLSNDWMTAEEPNQNLLRGSKAIADKVDIGMHLLPLRKDDVKSIQSILEKGGFDEPNLRLCVYKNRRGRYKNIILWCKADLGTCRINPIFCTDYNYNLINLDNLKIKIEKEESVF